MPNQYFQLYNHAYSFETSRVFTGGVTFSLPQNDYGIYGDQVDAYFNTITESVGATGNLAVWFVADKGLTYYRDDPGASAAITGYIQGRFPVTSSTEGLGLVDLRGAPEWKHLIGDGIIGPTLASTKSVTSYAGITGYVQSISVLMNLLSTTYPNIDWAIAGIPHLPFQMPLAPTGGAAPVWDASLTNTQSYGGWWDVAHPTGSTNLLYDWQIGSPELRDFYAEIASSGVQRYLFDQCLTSIGWICPDVRTPYVSEQEFYRYGYNPESNYQRNLRLNLIASDWALEKFSFNYPLISPVHPSRGLNQYDASNGRFLGIEYNQDTGAYSITASSFTGSSGAARENFYPAYQFRIDMLDAAIQGNANGFVYYDPLPTLIDAACTGNISVGATGYVAQTRSRNTFSSLFYGGSYQDGYAPSGSGYADPCVKTSLLQIASRTTIGYLNEIRETANIEAPSQPPQTFLARNGYIKTAKDPDAPAFIRNDDSITNHRPDLSDSLPWASNNSNNCCPPGCDNPNCTPSQSGFDLSGCTRTTSTCRLVYRCWNPNDPDNPGSECDSCEIQAIQLNCSNTCPCGCNGGTYVITSQDLANIIGSGTVGGNANCAGAPPLTIGGLPTNCTITIPGIDNPIWGPYLPQDSGCCVTCLCPFGFETRAELDCTQGFASSVNFSPCTTKILDTYTDDVSLFHILRNYQRSINDGVNFSMMRSGKRSLSWKNVYQPQLDANSHAIFVQSTDTILKASQSVPAIKSHYDKDPIRHYPGKYFT